MRFQRLLVRALTLAAIFGPMAYAERSSSNIKVAPRATASTPAAVKSQKRVSKSGSNILGFALKVAGPVAIGAAALAYLGMKMSKSAGVSIPQQKAEEVGPDRQLTESFDELLDGNVVAVDESGNATDVSVATLAGSHVCVIFDCNKDVGKKDEKSRLDFFQLMANLTTAGKISEDAKMKIVYVQGHGNKHLLESFAPSHWNFVANSKFGRAVAKALRLKFNVKDEEFRILMLGPDGKVTSENALDLLRISPQEMPWSARSLKEVLGTTFLGGAGGAELQEFDLKGKTVGLYFSASWCGPCKQFTPMLAKAYEKLLKGRAADIAASVGDLEAEGSEVTKLAEPAEAEAEEVAVEVETEAAEGSASIDGETNIATVKEQTAESEVPSKNSDKSGLEVVFVSLDQDPESFNTYRATMPWPALPFQDTRRALLQIGLAVKSVPTLILVDSEGNLITRSGVTELANDEDLARFPWGYDVIDLSQGVNIEKLQRNPALVALTDNCDAATRAAVRAAVKEVAVASKSPIQIPNSGRGELLHCILEEEGKLAEAIRELANLPVGVAGPQFALLDLPKEEFGIVPSSVDLSSTNFKSIFSQISQLYKSYSIQMENLKISESSGEK